MNWARFLMLFAIGLEGVLSWTPVLASESTLDLRSQFRSEIPQQMGGTCHVHAAVNLMEAACFRRTGKHLDISEGYVLYTNYLRQISRRDELTASSYIEDGAQTELAGDIDGGFVSEDLRYMIDGGICQEKKFPNLASMSTALSPFRDTIFALQTLVSTRLADAVAPALFCEAVEGAFTCSAKVAQQEDLEIKNCLKDPFQLRSQKFDKKIALSLLKRGIPYVCQGAAIFYEKDNFIEFVPNKTGHAAVVTGYNAKARTWILRDSMHSKPIKGAGRCDRMTWIE